MVQGRTNYIILLTILLCKLCFCVFASMLYFIKCISDIIYKNYIVNTIVYLFWYIILCSEICLGRHMSTHTDLHSHIEQHMSKQICENRFKYSGYKNTNITACTMLYYSIISYVMKQHQYNICIARPDRKCNMLKHTRAHTEETPFTCNHREILLGNNYIIDAAQVKHTTGKPYQYCIESMCTLICKENKQFSRNRLSYKPRRRGMPLSCTECDLDCGHLFCDRHNELLTKQISSYISILYMYCQILNNTICSVLHQRRTQLLEIENTSCYSNIKIIVKQFYLYINEKLFSCSYCGILQYIEDNWYFYILMEIHKGREPYQCNSVILCMYLFTREKPYQIRTLYQKPYYTDICMMFLCNAYYTVIVWAYCYKGCETLYGKNSHYSRYFAILLIFKWR